MSDDDLKRWAAEQAAQAPPITEDQARVVRTIFRKALADESQTPDVES
jgi:hypothetical protein